MRNFSMNQIFNILNTSNLLVLVFHLLLGHYFKFSQITQILHMDDSYVSYTEELIVCFGP